MATDERRIDMHDLQRDEGVEPERATIVSIVRLKLGVLNTRGTLPYAPPLYTARPSVVATKPNEHRHFQGPATPKSAAGDVMSCPGDEDSTRVNPSSESAKEVCPGATRPTNVSSTSYDVRGTISRGAAMVSIHGPTPSRTNTTAPPQPGHRRNIRKSSPNRAVPSFSQL